MMKFLFSNLRSILIALIFIASSHLVSAQTTREKDLIIKRDSSKIEALIIEVNELSIRYKKFSDKEGPDFSIPKRDVASVVYGNGETEHFPAVPEIYFDEAAPSPVTPYRNGEPVNRYRRGSVQSQDTKQLNFNYTFYLKKAAQYKTMSIVGASLGSLMTVAGIITASAALRDYNATGVSSRTIENRFTGGVMLTTVGVFGGVPLTIIGLVKKKNYTKKALLVKEELRRRNAPLASLKLHPGFDLVNRSATVSLRMSF